MMVKFIFFLQILPIFALPKVVYGPYAFRIRYVGSTSSPLSV
jgi:hypothetical protein